MENLGFASRIYLQEVTKEFRNSSRRASLGVAFIIKRENQFFLIVVLTNLVTVNKLNTPGFHFFEGWLANKEKNRFLSLGTFNTDWEGKGILCFPLSQCLQDSNSSLKDYNQIWITAEPNDGDYLPHTKVLQTKASLSFDGP